MPIQWGPQLKQLAEVGIENCSFCHELAAFSVYETSTTVRLMFLVPLAKLSTKYIIACERCHHTWEVTQSRALGLVAESKMLPSHEVCFALCRAFDSSIMEFLDGKGPFLHLKTIPEVFDAVCESLKKNFNPQHVEYAFSKYIESSDRD